MFRIFQNTTYCRTKGEKMQQLNIVYISLSGNTEYFIKQIEEYLTHKNNNISIKSINIKQLVKENIDFPKMNDTFVAFLPSYLEGGNGVENGVREILTTPLRTFLTYNDNYKKCCGIIGSGNRNFSKQFCLTAYQYSEQFGFPVLDEFELRGTIEDVERISKKIARLFNLEV